MAQEIGRCLWDPRLMFWSSHWDFQCECEILTLITPYDVTGLVLECHWPFTACRVFLESRKLEIEEQNREIEEKKAAKMLRLWSYLTRILDFLYRVMRQTAKKKLYMYSYHVQDVQTLNCE